MLSSSLLDRFALRAIAEMVGAAMGMRMLRRWTAPAQALRMRAMPPRWPSQRIGRVRALCSLRGMQMARGSGQKDGESDGRGSSMTISVDRSGLKQPPPPRGAGGSGGDGNARRSKETPLVDILRTMIEVKGPLTMAEYMQRALTHPNHGYYMKQDVLGAKGDFITAPEISQMFGELIGIWCVATWQQMGTPSSLKLVEMGPGRGTLMSDLLRCARSFPAFYQALDIHLVELSPMYRAIQRQTLGGAPIQNDSRGLEPLAIPDGPTVHWHEHLSSVPTGTSLIIAQEVFDALPIHQFEYTEKGWRERLIDVDYSDDAADHFCVVLSPGATPATRVFIGREKVFDPSQHQPVCGDDGSSRLVLSHQAQVGDKLEISPSGIALMQSMAQRVSTYGGGILVVDYGHDHPSQQSLRGIKNHAFVSALQEPGEVDLSIDVDFATLKRYALELPKLKSHGPIGQGAFLKAMGIEHRLAFLLQHCKTEQDKEELVSAFDRLVEPDQMGTIFKVMAVTHEDLAHPVGFDQL